MGAPRGQTWPQLAAASGVKLVVAALLAVGLAACLSSVATLPDRILAPDVVGVVTHQSQGSIPSSRVYDVGETFYISLVPIESMTIDADCYRLSGTTA